MKLYGKTDVGIVRSSNQDNFVVRNLDQNCAYAIVCDGMGGHNGGNIASELAVRSLDSALSAGYDASTRNRNVRNLLNNVVRHANGTVYSVSLKDEHLKGMGTTVVLAYVVDEQLYVAHVGDSRAYLFENGKMCPITKDHSIVQQMLDSGKITPEEAREHPYRHIITRVVGFTGDAEPDIGVFDFTPQSMVLLCSDGLTNVLEDDQIEAIIANTPHNQVCSELIRQANQGGGPDNITVAIIAGEDAGV